MLPFDVGTCVLLVVVSSLGFALGYLCDRFRNKPEVIFFPDAKLPCNSFYTQLAGRPFVCPRANCHFAHLEHGETSLMRIFLFLNEATQSIDLCLYDFTLTTLAEYLIAAKTRGIKIRIITDAHIGRQQNNTNQQTSGDNKQGKQQKQETANKPNSGDSKQGTGGDQIPKLQASGIPIKINKSDGQEYALMHNKFAIVDNKSLIMGSFNWTKAAVLKNHEAVIKTNDARIVEKFVEKFSEIWKETKVRPKK